MRFDRDWSIDLFIKMHRRLAIVIQCIQYSCCFCNLHMINRFHYVLKFWNCYHFTFTTLSHTHSNASYVFHFPHVLLNHHVKQVNHCQFVRLSHRCTVCVLINFDFLANDIFLLFLSPLMREPHAMCITKMHFFLFFFTANLSPWVAINEWIKVFIDCRPRLTL